MVTNQFCGLFADVKIDCLHTLLWRSTMDWPIKQLKKDNMAMIQLHCVKIW